MFRPSSRKNFERAVDSTWAAGWVDGHVRRSTTMESIPCSAKQCGRCPDWSGADDHDPRCDHAGVYLRPQPSSGLMAHDGLKRFEPNGPANRIPNVPRSSGGEDTSIQHAG